MSFQSYLDNIEAKTGKTPEEFWKLAQKRGLVEPAIRTGEIVAWLKADYELGQGHAMAIVKAFKNLSQPKLSTAGKVDRLFTGPKAQWKVTYDRLLKVIRAFGTDIDIFPTESYISVVRGDQKLAVIQLTAARMDIGIKLKGIRPKGRLEAAGSWNNMVTHRVRISEPGQIDQEVLDWLRQAYNALAP